MSGKHRSTDTPRNDSREEFALTLTSGSPLGEFAPNRIALQGFDLEAAKGPLDDPKAGRPEDKMYPWKFPILQIYSGESVAIRMGDVYDDWGMKCSRASPKQAPSLVTRLKGQCTQPLQPDLYGHATYGNLFHDLETRKKHSSR